MMPNLHARHQIKTQRIGEPPSAHQRERIARLEHLGQAGLSPLALQKAERLLRSLDLLHALEKKLDEIRPTLMNANRRESGAPSWLGSRFAACWARLYQLDGNPLHLAKATAIADAMTCMQNPDTGAFIPRANPPSPYTPTLGQEGTLTAYYGNPRQVFVSLGVNF